MDDDTIAFEADERTDRAAVAAFLRQLADGIEAGVVDLSDGEEQVVVEPSDELELEAELEMEATGEEGMVTTLAVAISWFEPFDELDDLQDAEEVERPAQA